jgi:hypothetical protein
LREPISTWGGPDAGVKQWLEKTGRETQYVILPQVNAAHSSKRGWREISKPGFLAAYFP